MCMWKQPENSAGLQISLESEARGVNPGSRDNSQLWTQDGSNLKAIRETLWQNAI